MQNKMFNRKIIFNKFSLYSKWIDICVYQHAYTSYLLQMKINRITNGKKFKATSIKSAFGLSAPEVHQLKPLLEIIVKDTFEKDLTEGIKL